MKVTILIPEAGEDFGPTVLEGEVRIGVTRGREALAGKAFSYSPEALADALVWLRGIIEGEKNATDTTLPWSDAA